MAQTPAWHGKTAAETAAFLRTDGETGLSDAEAARRLPKQNNSGIWHIRQTSLVRCAVRIFSDAAAVLLLLTAVIADAMKQPVQTAAIFLILAAYTVFRTVVYVRARREFFEATRRVFPRARVLRGGKVRRIGVDRIVTGDVVLLGPGDIVPCDLRILSADNLVADESAIGFGGCVRKQEAPLTTETLPEKRSNLLLAASNVTEGTCRGIAVCTGRRTFVCRTHGGVSVSAGEQIPYLNRLERLCRASSLTALGLVVVITFAGILCGGEGVSAAGVFLSALAFCVSAAGEFLSPAGHLSVALAMKHSGETRVRIKDPASVSRIGSADCFVIGSPSLIKSGRTKLCAWYSEGKFSEFNMDRRCDEPDEHGLSHLLELAYVTTGDVPESVSSLPDGSGTDYEMIRHLHQEYCRPEKVRLSAGRFVAAHMPGDVAAAAGLDTALLRMGGGYTVVVSGPPELVLRCCDTYQTPRGARELTEDVHREILSQMGYLRHRASTVVAVAAREAPVSTLNRPAALRCGMCFVGYFAVAEYLAEETVSFLADCRREKISFVLFSSGADSDRWFAAEAGLFTRRDLYLTGAEAPTALQHLERGQCAVVCAGQSDGEQAVRSQVIGALREGGMHVAYIDESTAEESAAQAADVIFAAMPYTPKAMACPQPLQAAADAVVSRGSSAGVVSDCVQTSGICRTSMLNLRHAALYLLSSGAAKAAVMLLGAIFSLPLLPPVPILLWGLVLDVFAVLSIIYTVPPRYIYFLPPSRYGLPGFGLELLYPLASGVLLGALSMLATVLAAAIRPAASAAAVPAIWLAVCFGTLVLAVEGMQDESMFRSRGRFTRTLGILAALVLLGTISVLLVPQAALFIGGARPDWLTGLCALFPGVLIAAACEIYKKVQPAGRT